MIHFSCHFSVLGYTQILGQAKVLGQHAHWFALAHAVLVLLESPAGGASPGAG